MKNPQATWWSWDSTDGLVPQYLLPNPAEEWRHRPPPPEGYAAACPCGSGNICTGQRGGRFCVRDSGTKKYFLRDP